MRSLRSTTLLLALATWTYAAESLGLPRYHPSLFHAAQKGGGGIRR
jgi:hypothetical protein